MKKTFNRKDVPVTKVPAKLKSTPNDAAMTGRVEACADEDKQGSKKTLSASFSAPKQTKDDGFGFWAFAIMANDTAVGMAPS